eukprot:2419201-Rhodomonas_salina.3
MSPTAPVDSSQVELDVPPLVGPGVYRRRARKEPESLSGVHPPSGFPAWQAPPMSALNYSVVPLCHAIVGLPALAVLPRGASPPDPKFLLQGRTWRTGAGGLSQSLSFSHPSAECRHTVTVPLSPPSVY